MLLILAAVSIATLTGENGILTKAGNAKEQTEIADIIERAKIDILGARAENNGDIEEVELDSILEPKYGTLSGEGEEKILTTDKGYIIKVSDIWSGTVGGEKNPVVPDFDENTLTIGTDAQNTDKYGWKVSEYTKQTSEMSTNVWRLFYQDSNYTYLITDEYVGSYMPSNYYSSYTDGSYVSTVGQKLSPIISSLFTSGNTNANIRTTAWLTDTSDAGMWSEYKNNDAVFAIGSPTAELFAASYNNRSNKSNTITLGLGTYGYTENTRSGWLSVNDNHGIYNKSTSSYWWLASPYSNDSTNELNVNGYHGYFNYSSASVDNHSNAVRPLVCIPTSVFDSNYTLKDV